MATIALSAQDAFWDVDSQQRIEAIKESARRLMDIGAELADEYWPS